MYSEDYFDDPDFDTSLPHLDPPGVIAGIRRPTVTKNHKRDLLRVEHKDTSELYLSEYQLSQQRYKHKKLLCLTLGDTNLRPAEFIRAFSLWQTLFLLCMLPVELYLEWVSFQQEEWILLGFRLFIFILTLFCGYVCFRTWGALRLKPVPKTFRKVERAGRASLATNFIFLVLSLVYIVQIVVQELEAVEWIDLSSVKLLKGCIVLVAGFGLFGQLNQQGKYLGSLKWLRENYQSDAPQRNNYYVKPRRRLEESVIIL